MSLVFGCNKQLSLCKTTTRQGVTSMMRRVSDMCSYSRTFPARSRLPRRTELIVFGPPCVILERPLFGVQTELNSLVRSTRVWDVVARTKPFFCLRVRTEKSYGSCLPQKREHSRYALPYRLVLHVEHIAVRSNICTEIDLSCKIMHEWRDVLPEI